MLVPSGSSTAALGWVEGGLRKGLAMQRTGSLWSREAPPSWQARAGLSWPLTAALYIRDVLKLPATQPFFIPPLVPGVPESISVIGPDLDIVLVDEWSAWFAGLVRSRADIQGFTGLLLEDCRPAFRQAVEPLLDAASTTATSLRERDDRLAMAGMKASGVVLPKLVRSIEKELGHKAAPFALDILILPVEGVWLHAAAPQRVLTNRATFSDSHHLHRLLGPVIRDLACPH